MYGIIYFVFVILLNNVMKEQNFLIYKIEAEQLSGSRQIQQSICERLRSAGRIFLFVPLN